MNRWQRQTMFVLRNDAGVIVGISETVPKEYRESTEIAVKQAYSASQDARKKLTEYQRKKIADKKTWMGGD